MNVEDIIGQKDLIGGGNIFRLQVIAFTATIFVLLYASLGHFDYFKVQAYSVSSLNMGYLIMG